MVKKSLRQFTLMATATVTLLLGNNDEAQYSGSGYPCSAGSRGS
ncbi:hypothetical protein [Citrobacter freundii]|nr:hypothetical protein [Citrobacter freundii]MDV0834818.1 hypothetical protein [Citrobacter freundii]MDV0870623.1 hypothetical protein [Citrobacter freundii]MDV0904904.1 hypothetical protein [Citrobacter freundii]MDV1669643.1 hypothetical protein [Citrobacter freundii]MDV1707902.1 hypothetical protein [Citrobacter freundii]